MSLRVRAPAKLNLYLRVVGKRPDGYHDIETIFERIDLADELTMDLHPRTLEMSCSDPALPCGDGNLVMRAALLLRQEGGVSAGARLRLEKRIPIAAGLGGGSADAAAALTGLNRLWDLKFPHNRLLELASQLGSDVPFFLGAEAFAIGRGRGDRCEPLASSARLSHVLITPPERLSTADVYAGAQFNLTAGKPSISIVAHALRNGSLGELAGGLWNDLAPEAIRRCPIIATIQASLREQGCFGALVSGSGSAVFGLLADGAQAQEAASRIRARAPRGWRIDITYTEHPSRVVTSAIS
jgi:4-diphosphocytidyl-2-C-methyl-D-erythritol kinase